MTRMSRDAALAILLGPTTPMGTSRYDEIHLAQLTRARDEWPLYTPIDPSSDPMTANQINGSCFYDLSLAEYLLYARTGDESFRTVARDIAKHVADEQFNIPGIPNWLAQDWTAVCNSPIYYQTVGCAIHYLDTGYTRSRDVVKAHASMATNQLPANFVDVSVGTRVAAYYLMAQACALLLGDTIGYPDGYQPDGVNIEVGAAAMLDSILVGQQTSGPLQGAWADTATEGANGMTGGQLFAQNFCNGLMLEALILYDRAIGECRIGPAIRACCDYLWTTQWHPDAGGPCTATAHGPGPYGTPADQTAPGVGNLQYTGFPDPAMTHNGAVNTNACEDYLALLPMTLAGFGYCYYLGYGDVYKERGDLIVTGFTQSDRQGAVYPDVKQQGQAFRSSPRYFGFVEEARCHRPPRRVRVGLAPPTPPTPPESP
jgi:hypothetical protein